jgi:hypothetical protein
MRVSLKRGRLKTMAGLVDLQLDEVRRKRGKPSFAFGSGRLSTMGGFFAFQRRMTSDYLRGEAECMCMDSFPHIFLPAQ